MTGHQPDLPVQTSATPAPAEALDLICACVRTLRIQEAGLAEFDIRDRVAVAVRAGGLHAKTEVVLGTGCRADIVAGDGIVIEIKRRRPDPKHLQRQLERYASQPVTRGLVVVAERHVPLPAKINGVLCRVVSLQGAWGIAV